MLLLLRRWNRSILKNDAEMPISLIFQSCSVLLLQWCCTVLPFPRLWDSHRQVVLGFYKTASLNILPVPSDLFIIIRTYIYLFNLGFLNFISYSLYVGIVYKDIPYVWLAEKKQSISNITRRLRILGWIFFVIWNFSIYPTYASLVWKDTYLLVIFTLLYVT